MGRQRPKIRPNYEFDEFGGYQVDANAEYEIYTLNKLKWELHSVLYDIEEVYKDIDFLVENKPNEMIRIDCDGKVLQFLDGTKYQAGYFREYFTPIKKAVDYKKKVYLKFNQNTAN